MARMKAAPIDKRILEPGWAGEPEPTELEFLARKLQRDGRLANKWGFTAPETERVDWAILQVAMWGDPQQQALNVALTRQKLNARIAVQLPLFWVDPRRNTWVTVV